jgi:Fe-S cluster assembly ATP-binding protein
MSAPFFEIKDLHVSVEGKKILHGLSLKVGAGEIHAIMGPNGSGKSTLSYAVLGHPRYLVESGDILLHGESLLSLKPNERAVKGLFLGFQYPVSVPGVSIVNFLRTAMKNRRGQDIALKDFRKELKENMKVLKMDAAFANRYLNEGFSGGEKKRLEILQMALLQPAMAILDETDSGLDIDALRIVSDGINRLSAPTRGILLITHYQRLLDYVKPPFRPRSVRGKNCSVRRPGTGAGIGKQGIRMAGRRCPVGRSFRGGLMTDKPDLKTLGQDYQFGFHDSMENYTFQSGKGLTANRRKHLLHEERTGMDADVSVGRARHLFEKSPCRPGRTRPAWPRSISTISTII